MRASICRSIYKLPILLGLIFLGSTATADITRIDADDYRVTVEVLGELDDLIEHRITLENLSDFDFFGPLSFEVVAVEDVSGSCKKGKGHKSHKSHKSEKSDKSHKSHKKHQKHKKHKNKSEKKHKKKHKKKKHQSGSTDCIVINEISDAIAAFNAPLFSFASLSLASAVSTAIITLETDNPVIVLDVDVIPAGGSHQFSIFTQGGSFEVIQAAVFQQASVPLVAFGVDLQVQQDQQVSLDASLSTGNIVSYQWVQNGGILVTLSDASSASPTFTAPTTSALTLGNEISFEMIITDDEGLTATDQVQVTVEATIPSSFFALEEADIPLQFGRDVSTGSLFALNGDGTGQVTNHTGIVSFTYIETATTLFIDFSAIGGYVEFSFTNYANVGGNTGIKELLNTTFIDSYLLTLVTNGVGRDDFTLETQGRGRSYNVTDDVLRNEYSTSSLVTQTVIDMDSLSAFDITGGETRLLYSNISTALATIADNQFKVLPDVLSFNADGTGTSRFKSSTFNWQQMSDGHINVLFSDGETADYYNLGSRVSGDVIATIYTYADGNVRVFSNLSFLDDPGQSFTALTTPGIYKTNLGAVTLGDGSVVDQFNSYRLHPDGTGQLEIQTYFYDDTNDLYRFISSTGICWHVTDGELVKVRSRAINQRFAGSKIPGVAYCNTVQNSQISHIRTHTLFDTNVEGKLRTLTRGQTNDCGFSVTNLPLPNCDANVLNDSEFFVRLFDVTPLTANPSISLDDSALVAEGTPSRIAVLANDINGDNPIDVTTLEVLDPPIFGSVSVDPSTGEIIYTAVAGGSNLFTSFGTNDIIYYQVKDAAGNLSTLGTLRISVSP